MLWGLSGGRKRKNRGSKLLSGRKNTQKRKNDPLKLLWRPSGWQKRKNRGSKLLSTPHSPFPNVSHQEQNRPPKHFSLLMCYIRKNAGGFVYGMPEAQTTT